MTVYLVTMTYRAFSTPMYTAFRDKQQALRLAARWRRCFPREIATLKRIDHRKTPRLTTFCSGPALRGWVR